jgi:hypothetical protein
MVNAWTELVYIQYFQSKEKAQSVMKSQVDEELRYYEEEEVQSEIGENGAFVDDGEYDDREKYRWNITEFEV